MSTQNLDLDADRSSALLGVSWFWAAGSIIVVTARIWCRAFYLRKVWWDDYLAIIATIFSLSMSIIWTVYAKHGGAKHIMALDPAEIIYTTRLNWISQPFCILGIVSGKISVAFLIERLQSRTKWRTVVLWTICSVGVAYAIVVIVLIYTQCNPVWLLWDRSTPQKLQAGFTDCWNPKILTNNAVALGTYMAVLDLVLAALPVHMVWNLQIPLKKKISICALLSTGIFAFIAGIIKTTELAADSVREDLTWATVDLFIWNSCEVNIVIIAACVPTLVPLFEVLTGRRKASSYRQHDYQHGSNFSSSNYHPQNNTRLQRLRPGMESKKPVVGDEGSARDLLVHDQGCKPIITVGRQNSDSRHTFENGRISVTRQFSVMNTSN